MKIEYPHNRAISEVMDLLKVYVQRLKEDYSDKISDLNEQWTDDGGSFSAKIMGFKLDGIFKILSDKIIIETKLPMMLKAFEPTVKDILFKELKKVFG